MKTIEKLRRYVVTLDGFDGASYNARSASAARYACFKAWKDAGYGRHDTFRDFLARIVSTLAMGETPSPTPGRME